MKTQRDRLQFALPSRYKGLPMYGPQYVEPWLDGVRAAVIIGTEGSSAVSLLGRTIINAYPVLDEITQSDLIENVVLDGEFLTRNRADLITVTTSAKRLDDTFGLVFQVYDIMTIGQWDDKLCEMPLHYRKSILGELMMRGNFRRIFFTPISHVRNEAERDRAKAIFTPHFDAVVYKDIEAPYPFGPTLDWTIDRK